MFLTRKIPSVLGGGRLAADYTLRTPSRTMKAPELNCLRHIQTGVTKTRVSTPTSVPRIRQA